MTAFVARLSELRRRFPQLRPRHWVEGKRANGSYGVLWLTPDATEMTEQDWKFAEGRFLAYVLEGTARSAPLFIVFNNAGDPIAFKLPEWPRCRGWNLLIDTTVTDTVPGGRGFGLGESSEAPPCSVLVFEGVK